jgi:lipoprotein-releasing system permease protein
VSVITLLAMVLGPVVGIATQIVVMAVMAGFQRDIRNAIFDYQAHVKLQANAGYIEDPQPMVDTLREWGYRATPVVSGPSMIQTRNRILPVGIKGIDPFTSDDTIKVKSKMIEGNYEIDETECLIGSVLADFLGLKVGDTVILHPTGKLQKQIMVDENGEIVIKDDEVYSPENLTVAGIFHMGMYEVDSGIVFVHLDEADTIFDIPWGSAHSIQIWTENPYDMRPLMAKFEANPELFPHVYVVTWEQENAQFLGVLQSEKYMQFFLQAIIMVVAAFAIMATLLTIVIQTTPEIGVLKAMGANPLAIQALFLLQGAIVGLIGIVGGSGLGYLVVRLRNYIAKGLEVAFGLELFPAKYYSLPQIPAEMNIPDLTLVLSTSFLFCVLAAVIPAIYASVLSPVTALRTDA